LATARSYAINELVLQNNTIYICLASHTSGTFNTDLAAGRWKQANPLTTAGDIMVYDGVDSVRVPVGSDGQVLVADSSQTNKLKWGYCCFW
jgi:fatty acid-binding protein DegV